MPKAWRVVKANYAASALTGDGARRFGGRWNSVGRPAIYAADSLAHAMMEILVHIDPTMPMGTFVALELDLPDNNIVDFPRGSLPPSWPRRAALHVTQALGDAWLRDSGGLAIRVPGAVVALEHNYVMNPGHPAFATWLPRQLARRPVPINFVPRLFRSSPTT
jgi:RES domain-containing protein